MKKTQPAQAPSAAAAIAGPPAVDPIEAIVTQALRTMFPVVKTVLTKVLQTETLGPQRAYVLSDIPAIMGGDGFTSRQFNRRVREAGMEQVARSLAGKLRGEFSTPLYNEWNTGETGDTNRQEVTDEELAAAGL